MNSSQVLLPIPTTCLAMLQSASIELFPQTMLRGPYRIRFPKPLHGALCLRNIQFGQYTVFVAPGRIPVETLEDLPDLDGHVLQIGNTLRLEVENRGCTAIEVSGTILCERDEGKGPSAHWRENNGAAADHVRRARETFRARNDELLGYSELDEVFSLPPAQQLFRPDRCPMPAGVQMHTCALLDPKTGKACRHLSQHQGPCSDWEGRVWDAVPPAAPPLIVIPRPTCGALRPDTHEACVLRTGHLEQHFDGLGQSWPEQATPSRKELERHAFERDHYLEEPDAWSAWESATDES